MKRSAFVRLVGYSRIWLILGGMVVALAISTVSSAAEAVEPVVSETALRLVDEARLAKLAGDATRQFALLRQAVSLAPDYEVARWQLGQIKVGDDWVAVEEAQRRAGANPKQAEYRELRGQHGESADGQLALARWCRKNDLHDEAKFHWASVLFVDPTNEEALEALDMHWSGGRLLTRDQIADERDQLREYKKRLKAWRPKIAKWERDVWSTNASKRESALKEIRSVADPEAIPALEQLSLGEKIADEKRVKESTELSLAVLDVLDKIHAPVATESLVRHAVFSPLPEVQASATAKLKPRPQHEYVPVLLSGLAMPLESSFTVRTAGDGSVHYQHSLFREGPESDWEVDTRLSLVQNNFGGRHYHFDVGSKKLTVGPPNSSWPRETAKKANISSRYLESYGRTAAATEMQVAQINQATEALNGAVTKVLLGATGEKFDTPREWWDWWRDDNEYYASDERPVDRQYYSDTDSYYFGAPSYSVSFPRPDPPPRGYGMSCFAKGTTVWTKTGQRPIETLELGDLVLAQNIESGELNFKPVVARTVRPPSEIVTISVEHEEVRTTLGHPFWVAGTGWRMAKELEDGAILHGVTGAPRVSSVEKAEKEEAYNLVVADFNTYFVGESGVLVHDNTPRTPTRATLPGLTAKQ
jgi:hypothetical protein